MYGSELIITQPVQCQLKYPYGFDEGVGNVLASKSIMEILRS